MSVMYVEGVLIWKLRSESKEKEVFYQVVVKKRLLPSEIYELNVAMQNPAVIW
jgi:hypothetical protein